MGALVPLRELSPPQRRAVERLCLVREQRGHRDAGRNREIPIIRTHQPRLLSEVRLDSDLRHHPAADRDALLYRRVRLRRGTGAKGWLLPGRTAALVSRRRTLEQLPQGLALVTRRPPILSNKHYDKASAFTPDNLLREARRQKQLQPAQVPEVCVLDPDGDIVRHLHATGRAERAADWACYHTELWCFAHDGHAFGIIGCAV